MAPSIHDNLLISYEVLCEERAIILRTEHRVKDQPTEFVNVFFKGVQGYHFENDAFGNIILGLETIPIENLLAEYGAAISETYRQAGSPGPWAADLGTASAYLRELGMQGFLLSSSFGLSGWVLGRDISIFRAPGDAVNQTTRQAWRELGFFYTRDDQARVWKLQGSRSGLLRFRDLLLVYANDSRNAAQSEHEHYGPYSYLEIMTWPEPGFDHHAIRGSLLDLKRLAVIVESKLLAALPGETVYIGDEFAANSPYGLVLEVREDGFDPAESDRMLPTEFR